MVKYSSKQKIIKNKGELLWVKLGKLRDNPNEGPQNNNPPSHKQGSYSIACQEAISPQEQIILSTKNNFNNPAKGKYLK